MALLTAIEDKLGVCLGGSAGSGDGAIGCFLPSILLAPLWITLEPPVPLVLHQVQLHNHHQLVPVIESVWYSSSQARVVQFAIQAISEVWVRSCSGQFFSLPASLLNSLMYSAMGLVPCLMLQISASMYRVCQIGP